MLTRSWWRACELDDVCTSATIIMMTRYSACSEVGGASQLPNEILAGVFNWLPWQVAGMNLVPSDKASKLSLSGHCWNSQRILQNSRLRLCRSLNELERITRKNLSAACIQLRAVGLPSPSTDIRPSCRGDWDVKGLLSSAVPCGQDGVPAVCSTAHEDFRLPGHRTSEKGAAESGTLAWGFTEPVVEPAVD